MNDSRNTIVGTACLLTVGLLAWSLGGCDLFTDGSADQTGTLEMLLTDAPFPFDAITEASVTITRVEVRQSSSGTDGTSDESLDGDDDLDDEVEADESDGESDDGSDESDDAEENGDDAEDDNSKDDGDVDAAQETDEGSTDENGDDGSTGDEPDDTDDDGEDGEDAEEDEGEDDLDGELDESADGDAGGGGSFVTIFEGEATFNLLELQGGVTASLASAELSAGDYTQVRLIVSSGHVALTDGREFDLTVPSGEQTGIKLHFDFTITSAETTTLLVDMDVSKAFVPTPGGDINDASQIQSFLFKPSQSIRIVEVDATGSISGVVVDDSGNPLAGITVTVSTGGDDVTTSATADDGSFVLSGLEPGSYDVTFSGTGFTDQTVTDVEVSVGTDAALSDLTLAAGTGET